MRWVRWILLVVALVLVAGSAIAVQLRDPLVARSRPHTPAPQPVVDENRILDARSGREFVPRGVNWSSFEYACAQGWGLSALDTVTARDPAASQAAAIAAWGANTVRLPLNQDCWLGTRGAPVSDEFEERTVAVYRAAVRDFVSALNDAGLVVVLDLHSRKRIGEPEFGNLAMPDSESLAFWRSVAAAYRDDPSVMFDAFNEPYSRYDNRDKELLLDLTWKCWRDGGCTAPVEDDKMLTAGRVTYQVQGMDSVVSAIRDTGAEQPILLGGLDYANDLNHWLEFAPDDDQLIASFHSYDFKPCSDRACWDDVLAPLADSVPVLTGELGSEHPKGDYVPSYLRWADAHHVGVLFWVWAAHPHDPMSLITEESGTPTAYGDVARAWLRGH
ncbi:cellulase family glycosylhydrolase [Nocardioides sp. KIGAM211]|uniref:Cellulase family glycosylhydrolase n=1 Tax=Nocardioides luti TaxID=2761101 RepID=A0A7X0VAT5_9ACTN|nr:cellulase family glycosylhydrolase [Nocardioides luti]MBB6627267.1 cellulase family glycosylhydrolase [Nocardioides luti]